MWLIVENSPENISLLKKLEFRFDDGAVEQPLLGLETAGLFTVGIKLANKNDFEYINPLPENFLEQIKLLTHIGMKPEEIIGVLKG